MCVLSAAWKYDGKTATWSFMFTSDDENLWLINFQSKKHIDFISPSMLGCKSSGCGQSSHITVKEKKRIRSERITGRNVFDGRRRGETTANPKYHYVAKEIDGLFGI